MVSIVNLKPVKELLAATLLKLQYFGILAPQFSSTSSLEHCLNAAEKDWDSCEDDE